MFNLEAGHKPDTGEMASTSASFARRSVVGLEGAFGLVTMGHEYTPIAQVAAATDTLGHGFYGTDLNTFDDSARDRIPRRATNTVNDKTPSFNGLFARLVYGFGERAAGPKANLLGLSAEYQRDATYLGAGFHQIT